MVDQYQVVLKGYYLMREKSRLLLVDDSAVNLDALLATLDQGHDLRVAINGQTALDLIATGYLPDLVLLDIMMPGMDGYEVCRRLKENEKTRDIPVIFLTALDSDEDEAKGLELGAVDYITKPFNLAIVRQRVNTQLELKQHRENLQCLIAEKNRELIETCNNLKKAHHQMLEQEKMASIGQLAAGVAHEINNPAGFVSANLTTLKTYAGKLNEALAYLENRLNAGADPAVKADIKEMKGKLKLDYIQGDIDDLIAESLEGVERIATIVRNLKSFFSFKEDKAEAVELEKLIESALNISWNEIKYKATVSKNYQPLPSLSCLPQQLVQVFVNLLVNAAQAIEEQGEIRIETCAEKNWVIARVCDNGSGIAGEDLAKVFEPFFTTKKTGMGIGLGLSICHDIVREHKGSIEVESLAGKGTCFTIKLPIDQGSTAEFHA
jgi:signal transduction histidine kinase